MLASDHFDAPPPQAPPPMPGSDEIRWSYPTYLIHRKFAQLLGATFFIFNPHEQQIMYSRLKAFKLKEDIRIFTGEDMQTEVLSIKARNILDIAATYDVFDSATGAKLGALKRKGLKSMLRDEWIILDASDREVGKIQEESLALALVRRFIDYAALFIPQKYTGTMNEKHVCSFQQNRNPFLTKMVVDFTPDTGNVIDRRVGVAAALLLCAIEGKQR
jgi:hypothetical protein